MASYGTAQGFADYCAVRGYDVPDGDAEPALLRASTYIDGTYGSRFAGRKAGGRAQDRAWPRVGVADGSGDAIASDEVPIEVEHATYEAALRELRAPGSLNPDFVASQAVKRERVDVIETEYFAGGSPSDVRPVVGVIDDLLAPLLTSPLSATASVIWPVRA